MSEVFAVPGMILIAAIVVIGVILMILSFVPQKKNHWDRKDALRIRLWSSAGVAVGLAVAALAFFQGSQEDGWNEETTEVFRLTTGVCLNAIAFLLGVSMITIGILVGRKERE